ncbi:hypothetical protein FA15DRAFT_677031 [Coprinopsis marcescibilis]|uniref:F-box domain-containing protein n=1 Tax=Coprinopsis marcescibilis TaxID=230819 RepID=A0A5C3LDQ9_COPMA|nr:hypothetical protein FA15DRAFT_677031 [Coprinopsis marcescibilis]
MASCYLFTIPPELIVEIFKFLDISSLLWVREICRAFKSVVDTTAILQYAIELHACGAVNASSSRLDIATRLKRIQAFQKSWGELTFKTKSTIKMSRGGLWELFGGVLAQKTQKGRSGFDFYRFPSSIRGIEEKKWNVPSPGFPVRDFCMDPGQDLLVLLQTPKISTNSTTYFLHLVSLETSPGEPHSLAPDSKTLEYVQRARNRHDTSFIIMISGDYIGLMIQAIPGNGLIVWDWKKGEQLLCLEGKHMNSFSFLSDEYVIISATVPGQQEDEEDDDIDREPCLAVVNFKKEGKTKRQINELDSVILFRYPPTHDEAFVVHTEIRSDPSSGWHPQLDIDVPFHVSQHNRLFVVTLYIQTVRGVENVMSFVPMKTLLLHLESIAQSGGEKKEFMWDEWGPNGSRLLVSPNMISHVWACYVYGSRYVGMETLRSDNDTWFCRVYDFNDVGVRRALVKADEGLTVAEEKTDEEDEERSARTVYQVAPTVIPEKTIFSTASFPLGLPDSKRCAPMCTEDNLIIVDTSDDEYICYSI